MNRLPSEQRLQIIEFYRKITFIHNNELLQPSNQDYNLAFYTTSFVGVDFILRMADFLKNF